MKLYVNTTTKNLESVEPKERFGDWYSSDETSIDCVSLTKTDRFDEEEFDVMFDANVGDDVYVLYMTYSSGDSFGHSDGNHETIWVFKDPILAYNAKDKYTNKSKKDSLDNKWTVECKVDGGQMLKLSNPAAGYFENMSDCDVQHFKIVK